MVKSSTTIELEKMINDLPASDIEKCHTMRRIIMDLVSLVDVKVGALALSMTGSQLTDMEE